MGTNLQGWAKLVGAQRKDLIKSQLQVDHKPTGDVTDDTARLVDNALIAAEEERLQILGKYNLGFSSAMLDSTETTLSNLNIAVRFVPAHAPWQNGLAEGQIRLNKREFSAAFVK
jgi:hypothetical protein